MLANSDTNQDIIWAYSRYSPIQPEGLQEHEDKGSMTLNLLNPLDPPESSSPPSNPSETKPSNPTNSSAQLLTYNQSLVAAHGIIMTVVFFFLLPFGSLLARVGRTFWPKWFIGHSIVQGWICGPLVLTGFVLAVVEVDRRDGLHLVTRHKVIRYPRFFNSLT